jgi:hypothetical protein
MVDSAQVAHVSWLERQPSLALLAIVAAACALNFASVWLGGGLDGSWLAPVIPGVWVMEPMLYGAWTAIGPGFFVTRLPLVAMCLMLSIAALGFAAATYADLERYEFVTLLVAGVAIYALATGMLLVVRWLVGLRIDDKQLRIVRKLPIQFSIAYLLILTTVVAIMVALFSSTTFSEPRPQLFSFGPGFFIEIIAFGSSCCCAALLPVLAAALLVMRAERSKNGMLLVGATWLITTVILMFIAVRMGGEWDWDVVFVPFVQMGGAAFAAFAAFLARAAGYRLYSRADGPRSPQ